MIRLKPTQVLELVLSAAVTTTELPIVCCHVDQGNAGDSKGGTTLARTFGTNAVIAAAAPASGSIRKVSFLTVRNSDTATATVTIRTRDLLTEQTYIHTALTLQIGDNLVYTAEGGFSVLDSSGNLQ